MSRPGPGPDPRRATAFGALAEEYERWRPRYPDAAVEWLLPAGAARVLDVGAGTGKLTRSLLDRGLDVVAVEPDPDMLAVLRRECPGAEPVRAGADALPVPDASVDAVLVGQAWHWFPHEPAVREVRRVLRPGGRLGLLWTGVAADVEGWPARIARLDPDAPATSAPPPARTTGLPEDELETADFPWTWTVTPAQARGLLSTHSALTLVPADERRRRLDEVEAIVAAACEAAGTPAVGWPQRTECVRWTPRTTQAAARSSTTTST